MTRVILNIRLVRTVNITFVVPHRLEYDEFVREFAKHLVVQFNDRVDTYVTAAMQASILLCFTLLNNSHSILFPFLKR